MPIELQFIKKYMRLLWMGNSILTVQHFFSYIIDLLFLRNVGFAIPHFEELQIHGIVIFSNQNVKFVTFLN